MHNELSPIQFVIEPEGLFSGEVLTPGAVYHHYRKWCNDGLHFHAGTFVAR